MDILRTVIYVVLGVVGAAGLAAMVLAYIFLDRILGVFGGGDDDES